MIRFDNLIRRLEAKEDEVTRLQARLNDRIDSARQHDSTSVKAAGYIQKLELDNRMLVKQIDLLTMEAQQKRKVDLDLIKNDERGDEIMQLRRELQEKTIENKMYA